MTRAARYLLIILAFILAGCEKDEKPLIGRWNMISSTLVRFDKGRIVYDTTYFHEPGKNVIELMSNGTAKIYRYNDLAGTYTWKISRKFLIISYYSDGYTGGSSSRYEFSFNDSMLNLRSEGVTKPYNISCRFVMTDTYSRY